MKKPTSRDPLKRKAVITLKQPDSKTANTHIAGDGSVLYTKTYRLPLQLAQEFGAWCKRRGCSETRMIREAIEGILRAA